MQFDGKVLDVLIDAALKHVLPVDVVLPIAWVESAGNPWAWNPEPHYRYLWDVKRGRPFRALTSGEAWNERPPTDFSCLAGDPDQEWWAQQASFGLLQVMGAVARERGLRAPYLTTLCDPRIGAEYGCRQLAHMRDLHLKRWGWDGVIAAYNAGSPRRAEGGAFVNQDYVEKVRRAKTAHAKLTPQEIRA